MKAFEGKVEGRGTKRQRGKNKMETGEKKDGEGKKIV